MAYSVAFVVDSVPFTKAVRDGETSLGGSESACVGLARALKARGHDVSIFATRLSDDAVGHDASGVLWQHYQDFAPRNEFFEWDVVCALRVFTAFTGRVQARQRWVWNQDLLVPGAMAESVMSVAWAYDQLCYVSDYHQQQWEDVQPELAGIGWATRNSYDPAHVPASVTKRPHQIIHISRPERGLGPLLNLWPLLKAKVPDATLQICRYSSMYDQGPGSWSDMCAKYDELVRLTQEQVGGITYLGELTKPALYQAIADSAVVWYPGVSTFAETSCLAAIEAAACGTPFVGSLKGALPETARPSYDAGLLIPGVAEGDELYAQRSVDAVVRLLDGCQRQSRTYREIQRAGRQHATAYTHAVVAAEWEARIAETFETRYQTQKTGVLRQLLHDDDHCAAKIVAEELGDRKTVAFCDRVMAGLEQTAEQYGEHAIQDPLIEIQISPRFRQVHATLKGCRRVLDVACGNGAFAISLAQAHPDVQILGLDYSPHVIALATAAAAQVGVGDRCTFRQATIWDYAMQQPHPEFAQALKDQAPFDGLFCGEFLEHVADCGGLVDRLEQPLVDGSPVVYTCPSGAFIELREKHAPDHKGHVHRFHQDDLTAVFGRKSDLQATYLAAGWSRRGNAIGAWLITYTKQPDRPAGARPYAQRIRRTRPMASLSVGLLTKNVENDLGRCLASVWPLADEILIGDTGSTDRTKAIAAEYGATIFDLDPIDQQPEGFAGARNAVLARATGDWYLWIDADEVLAGGIAFRKYLEGHVFHGYVLRQNHLQLDAPPHFDTPVRVFRRSQPIRFYGCVHEQPGLGDANGDVVPALDATDVQLAHTGYLTDAIRREKMIQRNLPLLQKDGLVFPERLLGKVILLRESVQQADRLREKAGRMTQAARESYAFALRLMQEHFTDPAHKYHAIVRPWYQAALRHLGMGFELELALAAKAGPLKDQHAQTERVWVADGAECQRLLAHKAKLMADQMDTVIFHTDPFVLPAREREAVSA